MSKIPHSSNKSIHDALRVLAREIQSGDGVANVAIAEAADRISKLGTKNERLHRENAALRNNQHKVLYWEKLEAENAELRKQLLQKTQLLEQENLRLMSILSRIRNVVDHSPDMSQATRLEWVGEYLDDALGRKEAQP